MSADNFFTYRIELYNFCSFTNSVPNEWGNNSFSKSWNSDKNNQIEWKILIWKIETKHQKDNWKKWIQFNQKPFGAVQKLESQMEKNLEKLPINPDEKTMETLEVQTENARKSFNTSVKARLRARPSHRAAQRAKALANRSEADGCSMLLQWQVLLTPYDYNGVTSVLPTECAYHIDLEKGKSRVESKKREKI